MFEFLADAALASIICCKLQTGVIIILIIALSCRYNYYIVIKILF